ncbi:tail fiber chaperone [Pseudomonas phage PspYZU05]|uniref:Uncharacterized protein n=1 Tax=Pseudomonas phage PspYZU05 TaxID=1983556 RepID=A0A2U7NN13_9CAUD|nr:tail fiber chaperone [Pseudomonas phage PspYZU05]ASD52057.1 hypothetical protein PspYZU05_105 [Pseudomonas phage PspYZU05]
MTQQQTPEQVIQQMSQQLIGLKARVFDLSEVIAQREETINQYAGAFKDIVTAADFESQGEQVDLAKFKEHLTTLVKAAKGDAKLAEVIELDKHRPVAPQPPMAPAVAQPVAPDDYHA